MKSDGRTTDGGRFTGLHHSVHTVIRVRIHRTDFKRLLQTIYTVFHFLHLAAHEVVVAKIEMIEDSKQICASKSIR
jgi:hypothetical protein